MGGGSDAVTLNTSARSAPGPHEIANGEIEANEHHERDKPLIALGRTVRDDENHAAVVDVRRASPQEGAKFWPSELLALPQLGARFPELGLPSGVIFITCISVV